MGGTPVPLDNRAGTIGGRRAVPGPYAAVVDAKYGWVQNKQPFVDAHPGVVGYTWYRWNHEKGGLVDHADNPHEENIAVLKKLNAEAENIRRAAVGR